MSVDRGSYLPQSSEESGVLAPTTASPSSRQSRRGTCVGQAFYTLRQVRNVGGPPLPLVAAWRFSQFFHIAEVGGSSGARWNSTVAASPLHQNQQMIAQDVLGPCQGSKPQGGDLSLTPLRHKTHLPRNLSDRAPWTPPKPRVHRTADLIRGKVEGEGGSREPGCRSLPDKQ